MGSGDISRGPESSSLRRAATISVRKIAARSGIRECETISCVMAIAVHPFVAGQPYRIGALDAALKYICSLSGVWRATGWEIVQHFLARLSKRAAAATL